MLTVEDLIKSTGYTKNTIYTLSVSLDIKPIRGQIEGNQSKGLYTLEDIKKLLLYRDRIAQGQAKDKAIEFVKAAYEQPHP